MVRSRAELARTTDWSGRTADPTVCLDVRGRLTVADRQRHHSFPFRVAADCRGLRIRFTFTPGAVGQHRNLLTLRLHGPGGFRGAAHRWAPRQTILLTPDEATPGFLSGPIEAGEWEVAIDAHEVLADGSAAGCTFRLRVEALGAGATEARAETARTRSTGPLERSAHGNEGPPSAGSRSRGLHWLGGDLHCHTTASDGSSEPAALARELSRRGLDFVAITDHNTPSWWVAGAGWPPDLLRIRGIEVTTFYGHANVLGATDWIDWREARPGLGLASIVRQAKAMGALVVANHPFAPDNPACTGCRWRLGAVGRRLDVDGIEVWNGPWRSEESDNEAALAWWTELLESGRRPTALGGSDAHHVSDYQRSGWAVSWVQAERRTERAILDAIRGGRVVLSSGPWLTTSVAASGAVFRPIPPGGVIPAGRLEVVAVVCRLRRAATLRLIGDGRVLDASVMAPPGGRTHLRGAFNRWSRLELRAGLHPDGELLVLTNPWFAEG